RERERAMSWRPLKDEVPFPDDLARALAAQGIVATDEVALRRGLGERVLGDNPFPLTPAPPPRRGRRHRGPLHPGHYDGPAAAQPYGHALLAALQAQAPAEPSIPPPDA